MRTNITLKVSITGTLIKEIAITGIFSSLTLNIWTAYASGAEVIYVIRNVAIQKPIKRDPASPTKSFLPFEKLYLMKIIQVAIKITVTEVIV